MGDSDNENYVTFGEPLEPLDEENLPRKKPVTIEEQIATDAQGRRRFHGAFTGGFSAGYFNTVGTRDGWRPQQFKSSRSNKAGSVNQLPEDFMDEEDTGEFGIAPIAIRTSSDYTSSAKGAKRERPRASEGPIPGVPVLQDILKPVTDTIGVALLKKMGWKPGQGVGPRVTRREKRRTRERNDKKKFYGCSLPNQEAKTTETTSESSDEDHEGILFAPDDYEPFRLNPKSNTFGIGYSGLERTSVLGHINLFDGPSLQLTEKNKKLSIKGQAFGVGAFEADDEDIYARDDMSRYDFTLGPESKKTPRRKPNESTVEGCLEGFVPAKNTLPRHKYFPPPELPKDFKPIHRVRKSRFSPAEDLKDSNQSTREMAHRKGLARHDLDVTDRSVILGESSSHDKPPGPDKISQGKPSPAANMITRTLNLHGREHLKNISETLKEPKKPAVSWLDKLSTTSFVRGGVEGAENTPGALQNLPEFKSSLGSTPKPFIEEEKQKRFEQYLEFVKNNERSKLSSIQPLSMTEWQRGREEEEFEQALRMCEGPGTSINKSDNIEDPMVAAARAKMFGKLTRVVEPWQPSSIICKRFNIPEPRTGCAKPEVKKKFSVFEGLDFSSDKFQRATDTAGTYKEPHIEYKSAGKKVERVEAVKEVEGTTGTQGAQGVQGELGHRLDTSDIDTRGSRSGKMRDFESSYGKIFGKGSEKTQDAEVSHGEETGKKDLFKAIFLSSSEDEGGDEGEGVEDGVNEDAVKALLIGRTMGEANPLRNDSPPRGIFAKLDLDELVKPTAKGTEGASGNFETRKLPTTPGEQKDSGGNLGGNSGENLGVEISMQTYGPALPAKSTRTESGNSEIVQKPVFRSVVVTKVERDQVQWIERKESKKKKKHKQKEKRHKHKKKSKR